MLLVLCRDPLEPSRPDRAFEAEVAAREARFASRPRRHDAWSGTTTPLGPCGGCPSRPEPVARGLSGLDAHAAASTGPALRGSRRPRASVLINDPEQYRHCHYLPESYPVIEGHTPRSVWLTGDLGLDRIMEALAPFGDGPVIVKDFVKSRKHEWAEACFIPSAADREAVAASRWAVPRTPGG